MLCFRCVVSFTCTAHCFLWKLPPFAATAVPTPCLKKRCGLCADIKNYALASLLSVSSQCRVYWVNFLIFRSCVLGVLALCIVMAAWRGIVRIGLQYWMHRERKLRCALSAGGCGGFWWKQSQDLAWPLAKWKKKYIRKDHSPAPLTHTHTPPSLLLYSVV